jgi:hypothetical protein
LEEIAWSDAVMQEVSQASGVGVSALRGDMLSLSQPAEAGWHFYADDRNKEQAESLASTWALAFAEQAQSDLASQVGLISFVRVDAAQVENLPVSRSVSQATYMMSGTVGFLALSALLILFFKPRK